MVLKHIKVIYVKA